MDTARVQRNEGRSAQKRTSDKTKSKQIQEKPHQSIIRRFPRILSLDQLSLFDTMAGGFKLKLQ